jgi:CheY-like chemotaxis protein
MAVNNMAHDYDINLDKIEFVDLLPHNQLAAFENGTLDAIACWEPWTTKARNMGGKMFFSGARSEIPGMEGDVNWLIDQACLMVADEDLTRHSQDIIVILHVLRKATDMINAHRQDVTKELAGFFELSQRELIAAMRKNAYSMKFDNLFRIGVLGFRDFLYKQGLVSDSFSEQDLYDTTLLQQIDPSLILLEETVSQDITIVEKSKVYYRQDVTLAGEGRDIRFLVADDSKVVREALAQTIEILGGEVLGEAATGQEAIEGFTRLRPNFVTMDLSMPGTSGIDAIKHILHVDPEVNIIVISATDLKELREEVFDLGVKIFIVKPFYPLQVAEIIGLLLL